MSTGLLSILQHYAQDDDASVRRNLCDALVADGSPEAADLLLDLATQDSDPQVNASASEQIANLSRDQLHAVQPTLARRFAPEKGKGHVLNWVRCADRIAKGTRTSLFAGLGSWRNEVRATRKLNRRMLLSRKNEYSFSARLLNLHVVISTVLAIVLSLVMRWLLISNPDDDLLFSAPFVAVLSVLFGGIPLAVMFAPPTLAFRRSVIAYVDATIVVKYAVVAILIIALLGVAVGESVDAQFFWPMVLYLLVPLFLVRLALNAATRIRHRAAYPLLLCLIVMGVLVAVYTGLLWVLDFVAPWWYEFGNIMSVYLMMTVPIALFLALHQGSFGNVVMYTGETARALFYNKLCWSALAVLAFAFIAVVAIAPGSGVSPPGRGKVVPIALPASNANEADTRRFQMLLVSRESETIVQDLTLLMKDLAQKGSSRQLISVIEQMLPEIEKATSARQLRELTDGMLDAVYSVNVASDLFIPFERLADRMYSLSDQLDSAGPEGVTQTISFTRTQRIEFKAPGDGDLELSVTAWRNDRITEVVIWLNGTRIDERSWSDPELFQGEIKKGTSILIADVPARKVDSNGIVSHFQARIAYVMKTYMFFDMVGTRGGQNSDGIEVKFQADVIWRPDATPVLMPSGPQL